MGADGGSIPKRVEMVKTKKGPLEAGQIDESEILRARWTRCFISKEPLEKPIVACPLGRLYNKEAVIRFLMNRAEYDESLLKELDHIKSLKVLINCQLKSKLNTNSEDDGEEVADYFVCPITLREMNGKCRFYVTRGCGCVLSEPALSQFPESKNCIVCERPDFDFKRDLIPLYPRGEELEALKQALKGKSKKRLTESTETTESTESFNSKKQTESSAAALMFEEIKSAAGDKEIGVLKRSKVTESLYHNKS